MVNKTQFYKTKVAMAVVLSLGLAACGDSDGDQSTATTDSTSVVEAPDNTVEQVQGTGSVQGTVLDTNGLPVMGAMVSLAGKTVETDASGYYHITDVPLPGVDGVNTEGSGIVVGNDLESAGYNVTITTPDGYANAIVKVIAEDIQVDSGNNGGSANTGNTDASGEQTTWFDGFLAQADNAVVPAFGATISGVLRDCNTGAALPAGVKLALDFKAISTTGTAPAANITLGVPVFTAMTGANGVYSFANLPVDSDLSLAVEGYTSVLGAGSATEAEVASVKTIAEGINNNLGDMNVCAITSSDGVAPYISSVDSVITDNTDDGFKWQVLSQGKDGTEGIVLRFNEALDKDAINTDAVIVTSQVSFSNSAAGEKVETVASAVVADDGLSMTITLAAALPEMTKFSVWMPRHEYQDTSANRIITGDASGTEFDSSGADNLVPDVAGTSTAAAAAVAATGDLDLNVSAGLAFTALSAGTAGNTLTVKVVDNGGALAISLDASGIVISLDEGTGTDTLTAIAAAITADPAASALVSVAVKGVGTSVYNTVQNITLTGGAAATTGSTANATGSSEFGVSSDTINDTQFKTEYVRTRLCTYIQPVTTPGTIDGEQRVKTTVAADDTIDAVGVFWDNTGSSTISNLNGQHDQTEDLLQELWNRKNPTSAQTIVDNTAVIDGNLNDASSIITSTGTASTAAGKWKVVVPSASHGQKVVVTPTAAFNIIGTPITVTLEDKVAPTTVIQDSYNYADTMGDDYVNSVAADNGYANGGELSSVGTSGSEGSPILYVTPRLIASDEDGDGDANFENRFDIFRSLAEGNTLNTATTPAPHVTSTTNFIYDVNAFAAWSAISANVGVAFSENINLVTGQAVGFALSNAAPTSTLTGFVANNSKNNEDYIANDADQDGYHSYLTHGLVQMTSNDVVALANLDHNAVIDYTGAVSDTVNANVALSDSLVVIADAIPPFVTKAERNATEFVVTFNEPVSTTTGAIVVKNPTTGATDVTLNVSAATSNADNTVLTWTAGLPARATFRNSTVLLAPVTADVDGVATFNGVAENETYTGTFGFAETTGGEVLGHALLSWGSVNDARGNSWNDYHNLYIDNGVLAGSTNANGVIDTQEDSVASTNGFRLAIPDLPMFLATDTIVPFGVTVAFSALDEDGTPGVDANFTVTITATNPISLTNEVGGVTYATATAGEVAAEDGWRTLAGAATNVVNGWDLTEINSHFRIVNMLALQTTLNTTDGPGAGGALASDLVINGGNNDGQVSIEEFHNHEGQAALTTAIDANDFPMIAGTSASFNSSTTPTVLTIDATVAANTFQQGANVEFIKITPTYVNITGQTGALTVNAANIVTPAGDDVDIRFGHIEGTILGNGDEEQSGSIARKF